MLQQGERTGISKPLYIFLRHDFYINKDLNATRNREDAVIISINFL